MVIRLMSLLLCLTLLSEARAENPLRLITFSVPPLVELDENGKPEGIAVDVITRLFRLSGEEYTLVVQPVKRAILSAMQDPNTCAFPITRSQERESSLSWVGPVSVSRHALYSDPERPVRIRTLEDARDFAISSYLGSGIGEYLDNLGFEVHMAPQNELGLRMLAAKRVQLWAADTRAAPLIADKIGIKLGDPELVFFTTLRSMGCHRDVDPERVARLTKNLRQLFRDGKLDSVLQLDL